MSTDTKVPKGFPDTDAINFFARRFESCDSSAVEAIIAVHRLSQNLTKAVEAHFNRHGFSTGGFKVMMVLLREGGTLTPADIAVKLDVSRATITGIIDTLAGQNLISRESDPSDRRVVQVALTDPGRIKLDAFLPVHYDKVCKLMDAFDLPQRKNLVSLMHKLNDQLSIFQDKEG